MSKRERRALREYRKRQAFIMRHPPTVKDYDPSRDGRALVVAVRVGDGPPVAGSGVQPCSICHHPAWAAPSTLELMSKGVVLLCNRCFFKHGFAQNAEEGKAAVVVTPSSLRELEEDARSEGGDAL